MGSRDIALRYEKNLGSMSSQRYDEEADDPEPEGADQQSQEVGGYEPTSARSVSEDPEGEQRQNHPSECRESKEAQERPMGLVLEGPPIESNQDDLEQRKGRAQQREASDPA
jgi:hypothetical protein